MLSTFGDFFRFSSIFKVNFRLLATFFDPRRFVDPIIFLAKFSSIFVNFRWHFSSFVGDRLCTHVIKSIVDALVGASVVNKMCQIDSRRPNRCLIFCKSVFVNLCQFSLRFINFCRWSIVCTCYKVDSRCSSQCHILKSRFSAILGNFHWDLSTFVDDRLCTRVIKSTVDALVVVSFM